MKFNPNMTFISHISIIHKSISTNIFYHLETRHCFHQGGNPYKFLWSQSRTKNDLCPHQGKDYLLGSKKDAKVQYPLVDMKGHHTRYRARKVATRKQLWHRDPGDRRFGVAMPLTESV